MTMMVCWAPRKPCHDGDGDEREAHSRGPFRECTGAKRDEDDEQGFEVHVNQVGVRDRIPGQAGNHSRGHANENQVCRE